MNTIEDRLRDAFRADALTVTAVPQFTGQETVPAGAAGRGRAGRRSWRRASGPGGRLLRPLAAAAAVTAIAVFAALAVPRLLPGSGTAAGPISPDARAALFGPGTPARQPPFLVGVSGGSGPDGIGVYSSRTGRLTASLRPPRPGLSFRASAATAADLTFVVAAERGPKSCATWLYRLRLTPRGRIASLTPLAVPKVAGEILPPSGLSASATGKVIAYTADRCGGGKGWLGVIHLASRSVRTWRADSEDLWSLSLSASGTALLYVDTQVYGGDGTVRLLRTDAPPGALSARARVVLPASQGIGEAGSVALSPDGKTLLACAESQHAAALSAYSTATGSLLGQLHQWRNVNVSPCMISAVPNGRYVLVSDILLRSIGTRLDLVTGRARPVPGGQPDPLAGISW